MPSEKTSDADQGVGSTPPAPESAAPLVEAASNVSPAPGIPAPGTNIPIDSPPDSAETMGYKTSDQLLQIYANKRIEGQLKFYKARIREFDANAGFMVGIGAGIMALSSMISAVGAFTNSPTLALITALLPAIASSIAAFRQLYQWEKQANLYRDAALGLEEARLIIPDDDIFDQRAAPVILPRLVAATEDVFMAEINQWGQIALGKPSEEEDKDELNKMLRGLKENDAAAVEQLQRATSEINISGTPFGG